MGTLDKIIKVAVVGAAVGAIIAVGICLFDTKIVGQDIYGEPIIRPAYPSLVEKIDAWVDMLPKWMLIGALAVSITVWLIRPND